MAGESTALLQQLLDRHAAGDPNARNELIRHSQDRLLRLTQKLLRRSPRLRRWENTSDVCQNVSVRMERALREATPATPCDLLCLAAALIRRELIDLARHHFGPLGPARHHASPVRDPDAPRPEPADPSGDPARLVVWQQLHEDIEGLPKEDQILFDLLYYQRLTQPQAAKLLGMPLRTLKRHWAQARSRLMERFGDDLPI
jgi:RNA polymerase sigma-70 factor (ECF subfamily)